MQTTNATVVGNLYQHRHPVNVLTFSLALLICCPFEQLSQSCSTESPPIINMSSPSFLPTENMADDLMSQPMSNPTPFCLPQEAEYSSDSDNSGSYDLDTTEFDAYIPTTADIIDLINTFDQQELAFTAESYKVTPHLLPHPT